jgi:PAS domain S-box-containing protein
LPVIYITTEIGEDTLEWLKDAGPYGFLLRPFNPVQIHAMIELALHHHQVQLNINQSRSQTSAILKSIGEGVIAIDGQARVLFMNPVAVMLTGWQEQEAIGQAVDSVVKICDQSTHQEIEINQVVKSFHKTGPLSDYEVLLMNRSGNLIPVEVTVAPMRGQAVDIQGVVIGIRDTTELRRSLQVMKLHIERSETLLEIIAKLNSHLDLDKLLSSLLEETTYIIGAEASAAFLFSEERKIYRISSTYTVNENLLKYRPAEFEIPLDTFNAIVPQDQPVLVIPNVQDQSSFPYRDFLAQEDIRTLAIAKLQRDSQVFGALAIINVGRMRDYSREDLQFIKGLADQASIAITNASLFENVRASRARLQALSKRLVDVQEAERRSLARELHDQVGQTLTGLQFSLELGKRQTEGELKGLLEGSQEIVSSLMQQIRDLSTRLLPSMLEDLGLAPTLAWMLDNFSRQTGIQVHFDQSGMDRRFPDDVEMTAYRIVQESLTNIARYAHTNEAFITLKTDEAVISIQVQDFGAGFDAEKTIAEEPAFGLTNMRERAFLAGGELTIKSEPGKGTEISASLPISSPPERRKNGH